MPISTLHTEANNESLPAFEEYWDDNDDNDVQDKGQSDQDDGSGDTDGSPEASEMMEEACLGTVHMLEDLLCLLISIWSRQTR